MYRIILILLTCFILIPHVVFCQFEYSLLSGRLLAFTSEDPNTILNGALVVIIDANNGSLLGWDKTDDLGKWSIDKLPADDRPIIAATYFPKSSGDFFFAVESTLLMGGKLSFGITWSALWTKESAELLIEKHGLISSSTITNVANIDIWETLYKHKLFDVKISAKNYNEVITKFVKRIKNEIKTKQIYTKHSKKKKKSKSISDYFPMKVGSIWKYQITLGQTKPIWHKYVGYLIGDAGEFIPMEYRGKFIPSLAALPSSKFNLVLRIDKAVIRQGPVRSPGVEIAIDADDLGIYEKNFKLFWSIIESKSPPHVVLEVATYRSDRLQVPQGWGIKDRGFSQRAAFFIGEPKAPISFGRNSGEALVYIGLESGKLHFTRFYNESQDVTDVELSLAFNENLWFEKGKGLVRLEQRIADKVSMTWDLIKFVPGK